MERSLEQSIHAHLAKHLAGEEQLDDFKLWLVSATWTLDQTQQTPEIQLANEIKLVLAEHSGGFLSDKELRDELVTLLNRAQTDALIRR